MAAHGSKEAMLERNQVEHQMMEAFRQYAAQQSAQFELAAKAEHQYLTNAARLEADASRQELVLAQTRFQDSSMWKVFSLTRRCETVQSARTCKVFVPRMRITHVCLSVQNTTGSSCR